MSPLRRGFYMLLGFSFPFAWAFHMEGFLAYLYSPVQAVASTHSTTWPSFITAALFYGGLIVLIEKIFSRREHVAPEPHILHQQFLFDHNPALKKQSLGKEPDQPPPPDPSAKPKDSSQKTWP